MSLPLSAAPQRLTFPMRLLLFVVPAAVGFVGGFGWNVELTDVPYNFLLRPFLDPSFQVTSLGVAVALGFAVGLAHLVRI